MRVLLINPITYDSFENFLNDIKNHKINADENMGLLYIQSYLKQNNPNVICEVFDWHFECLKQFLEYKKQTKINNPDWCIENLEFILRSKIIEFKPEIVGVSGLYEFSKNIFHKTLEIVKDVDNKIVTVVGGIYPTTNEMNDKNIDFIIKGEGEVKFKDLIYKQLHKKGYIDTNEFNNYLFKNGYKKDFIENLDDLPFPERNNIGKYNVYGRQFIDRFLDQENVKTATIQTDRGCPCHCKYCSGNVITNRNFRHRSVENIIQEIKQFKYKHNINVFLFNSENASVNTKWSKELFKALIPLNIKWAHCGGFYVNSMDKEYVDLAIESGLIMFNLAIESGSKRIQKLTNKSESIVDCAGEVVKWIREKNNKICIHAFFLSGFPFETIEDVELSEDLAIELDLDWVFWNIFVPFKGSELYDYCLVNNMIKNENNGVHYINSTLQNTEIDMKELSDRIYQFQLWYNFDNNRSMRVGNYNQAIRDFNHVLNVTNGKHEKANKYLNEIYEKTKVYDYYDLGE